MTENKLKEFGFYKTGLDRFFSSELDFEIRHYKKDKPEMLVRQILNYGIEYGKEVGKSELQNNIKRLLNIEEK